MDPIPTKCLEENTRLSLQGENNDPAERANLTAPVCVDGLEETTRSPMSKGKHCTAKSKVTLITLLTRQLIVSLMATIKQSSYCKLPKDCPFQESCIST